MESSSAKLLVLVGKHFACIKVVGRANFNSSFDFRTVITELQARDYSCFVIDLGECVLMDSTFLGVLAGIGLRMQHNRVAGDASRVTLLNPNPRVTELLENLGASDLFRIAQGSLAPPEALRECATQPGQATREELTRACLEAHETLMTLNPENAVRFKEVAKFLVEDLKKFRR